MKRFLTLVLALVLTIGFASIASAETQKRTVTFWHCMGGTIGEAVQANVDAFNASQDEIFVDAQYQGAYDDSLIKVKAAVPAGEGPDVFQMFEMATSYLADVDWVVPFSRSPREGSLHEPGRHRRRDPQLLHRGRQVHVPALQPVFPDHVLQQGRF